MITTPKRDGINSRDLYYRSLDQILDGFRDPEV
jgi:hypothetical protein